jgi:glycosyltransferase involved in cell wall biosynthesis
MKLSVIIPARNASSHLEHLLSALVPQLTSEDECLLIDDASTDDTGDLARRRNVTVLKMDARGGPAAARNEGAKHATGDVLLFLDADVVPHSDLLRRVSEEMMLRPEIDALMGSYDANPSGETTVSRFRNLLHCYTHHHGNPEAGTFWAGCGAMRRAVFADLSGFDAEQFPYPSIEDIELGVRLKRKGGRIRLDPTLLVQHRKVWSLPDMVRTDIFRRAIPWTKLILSSGNMPLDLNLAASQRISGAAVALACLLLLASPWLPALSLAAVALLMMVAVLNRSLYRFLADCGGWWFALRSIPLHFLYYLCSVAGYVIARIQFHLGR